MPLLLGIDLGTSYFKVGLFNEQGALRGLGRVAVAKSSPAPGRFELPAELFWERLRRACHEALRQAKAKPEDIAGVSYSSQANTFLLLDAHDAPLTPLVFWNDVRAAPVNEALAQFGETGKFARTTGFSGLTPEFSPCKWKWFKDHHPEL